ncbi:hypothetical protein Dsin_001836 [Dipteronia sinensis]|uniref:RNase H type-1 domain-containing protein n=1 Tax=Dipteronia sinensis TaxID=43782 RepID=A0AAE0B639_9ROSI|nr:hypothetical protein Dsin_001836 [Dipteronia sinensis]
MTQGEWHLPQLAAVLPWNVVHRINSIHAGKPHSGPDKVIWGWNKSGDFSVKSAYQGAIEAGRCNSGIESIDHLLQGCRDYVYVCESVYKGSKSSAKFIGDLEGWLTGNLQSGKLTSANLPNYLHFSSVLCGDVFPLPIAWLEPNENWVKLNIDGSRNSESGIITARGVLHNHWKSWLKGFVLNKGIGSVIEAKLWGLYEGLKMA